MLTNLKSLLEKAEQAHCAVLAPDFTSLRVARAMIQEAEALEVPLILSYSNAFRSIMDISDYPTFVHLIRKEVERASVPICLHLDHGGTLEEIQEAIQVGFSSVMLDASQDPWQENVGKTQETVALARPHGVSVEAELGQIGSGEGYFTQTEREPFFTDPEKAQEFAELTGVDALAVSIGNVHGRYQGEANLDYQRLEQLNRSVPVPLVLHGTSGLKTTDLQRAVGLGIRKINLYSDIVYAMHSEMAEVLSQTLSDPVQVIEAQQRGVKKVIRHYINVMNSCTEVEDE